MKYIKSGRCYLIAMDFLSRVYNEKIYDSLDYSYKLEIANKATQFVNKYPLCEYENLRADILDSVVRATLLVDFDDVLKIAEEIYDYDNTIGAFYLNNSYKDSESIIRDYNLRKQYDNKYEES